jgi:hypothetical protein
VSLLWLLRSKEAATRCLHYRKRVSIEARHSRQDCTFACAHPILASHNRGHRDAKALHLKLDELIRSHLPARNDMIDIEKMSDEDLDELMNSKSVMRPSARSTGAQRT